MNKLLPIIVLLIGILSGCGGRKIPTVDPDTSDAPEIVWDASQDSMRTGNQTVDFYNFNDLHGSIELSGNEPGIARISSYLKERKTANPGGYVFTSTGDMWQGSADSNITKGKLVVDWMNYEGCAAMALGNHEFDWTIDVILANQERANFPFLACNILNKETGKAVDWAKPYTTITRNGVHVGIIGAIGEGITTSIISSNVRGLTFDNPDGYVVKWSNYLKDNGADVILFLYHFAPEDTNTSLGKYVDGVFGGHDHKEAKKYLSNSVPALEAQANGKGVSRISMKYDFSKKEVSYGVCNNSQIYPNYYEDNPEVVEIKNQYADQINAVKNEQVAKIDRYMDAYNDIPLLYDRYAYQYYKNDIGGNRDIKFVVTNTARSGLNAGIITYGDIYKALPFDNRLTLCRAKGKDIRNITSYTSSRWYLPGVSETLIDRNDISGYLSPNDEYYFLAIDYVSTYENYASWINIDETFMEEAALPRNIVKKYMGIEFPIS